MRKIVDNKKLTTEKRIELNSIGKIITTSMIKAE